MLALFYGNSSAKTIVVILIVSVLSTNIFSYDCVGGTGEPNNPYEISTAAQLLSIGSDANLLDKCFILLNDIDLDPNLPDSQVFAGALIAPNIGGHAPFFSGPIFTGCFDGNDHVIYNLVIHAPNQDYIGLFGGIGSYAQIKRLGIENANITGESCIGGLAGYSGYVTITNCYVTGKVTGIHHVGGLVGGDDFSTFEDCWTAGNVDGNNLVGGLLGYSGAGTITECYATVSVIGCNSVGGLVGGNGSTITSCYATGSVEGNSALGGLVGDNLFGSITSCYADSMVNGNSSAGGLVGMSKFGATISNCYAIGNISAGEGVGGLVGHNRDTSILNCYAAAIVDGDDFTGGLVGISYDFESPSCYMCCFWDSDINPDINGIGNITDPNVVGESTINMQTETTFTDAGWDFFGDNKPSDDWGMPEGGGYPIVWWRVEAPPPPLPEFSGGAGTLVEPYVIANADDLNDIGHNPRLMNKYFQLAQDINLSGQSFYIIGSIGYPFTGVFDGNCFNISNFTYKDTKSNYVGFFSYVYGPNTEIRNLTLITPNVNAGTNDYIGALIGFLRSGTVNNCHIQGGNIEGNKQTGGLVGDSSGMILNCQVNTSVRGATYDTGGLVGENSGIILNCYVTGSVDGNHFAGGLVGWNSETVSNCYATCSVAGNYETGGLVGQNCETITKCYATGSVDGGRHATGGLVGRNGSAGTISDCYSMGKVRGDSETGGLLGYLYDGVVSNSYAVGSVDGNDNTGGLVGGKYQGTVSACFWDVETSEQQGSFGGTAKTTAEMQTKSTFTDAGWDFVEIWDIGEKQTYPFLRTHPAGDINHDDIVNFYDLAIFANYWLQGF